MQRRTFTSNGICFDDVMSHVDDTHHFFIALQWLLRCTRLGLMDILSFEVSGLVGGVSTLGCMIQQVVED